ncbi:MAG: PIG-L family deacetylase [Chloroflexota bacterium]
MANKRLLISYAHPDDESFGLGGLIAKYVDEGVDVYLICATDGAAGSMDEQFLEGGRSIRDVRLAELDCAAQTLNLKEVFMLGYRDSGMMGSDDNEVPESLWSTWHREPGSVTQRVVEVLRQVRPHVIITFNEYGGYGHPDHIAIQQATVQAMDVVNDPTYITDGLAPWQPQKLYFSDIPKFPVQLGIFMTKLRGKDPRKLGRNEDMDIVAILEHVSEPTTKIDVSSYYDAWDASSDCHKSQQTGGGFLNIPTWLRRRLFPTQGFVRMYPIGTPGHVDERDLFANVTVEKDVVTA